MELSFLPDMNQCSPLLWRNMAMPEVCFGHGTTFPGIPGVKVIAATHFKKV